MERLTATPSRRRWLLSVGACLSAGLAGCVGADGSAAATGGSTCADAVEVTALSARIGTGVVPRVRLEIHNTGDRPVDYEVRVVFQQGTSLGIPARTGRDRISGTLGPGERVRRAATDDARDVRNTDRYELDVSAMCASA